MRARTSRGGTGRRTRCREPTIVANRSPYSEVPITSSGSRGTRGERMHVVEGTAALGESPVSGEGRSNRTSLQPMCGTPAPRSPAADLSRDQPSRPRRQFLGPLEEQRTPRQIPSRRRACRLRGHGSARAGRALQVAYRQRERPHPRIDQHHRRRAAPRWIAGHPRVAPTCSSAFSPSGGCPSRSRHAIAHYEGALGARHPVLAGIRSDGGPQRPSQRLERRLDHVVGFGARSR